MICRLTSIAISAALLAALVAGCGGDSDEEPGMELAELTPSDALFYGETAIRPEGALKNNVEGFLEKFPNGDEVGDRLIESIEEESAEDDSPGSETTESDDDGPTPPGLEGILGEDGSNRDGGDDGDGDGNPFSYEDDIEPWLGERAAFFATGLDVSPDEFGESETELSEGAILVETRDADQARDKLRELTSEEEGEPTELEYEGVSYDLYENAEATEDFNAIAVVEGIAIIATEDGLKAAVDASNAESFEANEQYDGFLGEDRDGEVFASFFVDLATIFDQLPPSAFTAKERQQLEGIYGDYLKEPILGAVEVSSDAAALEYTGATGEFSAPLVEQTPLLDAGFEDTWGLFAASDIGSLLGPFVSDPASLGITQRELDIVDAQLQREAGIKLTDLQAFGDLAVFASGESITELQVGGVVELPDQAVRQRLLGALRQAVIREGAAQVAPLTIQGAEGFSIQPVGLPVPINVAASGDRVVIAGGDPATEALLSGDGGVQSSEGFERASGALGDGFAVNFLVETDPVIALVESTGEDDEDFQEAKPYLEAIDYIASGTATSGGRDISRLVVGVK